MQRLLRRDCSIALGMPRIPGKSIISFVTKLDYPISPLGQMSISYLPGLPPVLSFNPMLFVPSAMTLIYIAFRLSSLSRLQSLSGDASRKPRSAIPGLALSAFLFTSDRGDERGTAATRITRVMEIDYAKAWAFSRSHSGSHPTPCRVPSLVDALYAYYRNFDDTPRAHPLCRTWLSLVLMLLQCTQ